MTRGIKPCQKGHVVPGKRWDTFFRVPPCGTVAEIQQGGHETDCLECHMRAATRPAAFGMEDRPGRQHLFRGGHDPERVKSALTVSYHLLDEARRKRIGYQNQEPIHYPIYQERFSLPGQR